jgi:predicted HicB family RNase H-like nuclease
MIKQEQATGKWVKMRITSEVHKELKKLAIDEEVSLTELLKRAIKLYLKKGREVSSRNVKY